MASTYSALKIELIATGEQSGTWGTTTNTNIGDAALGEAITGSATVDFATAADVTITLTDVNTTQSARNLRLNITESSAGIGYVGNLILGSGCQIEKFYLINNTGTGAKTVKNTSGTGIAVPAGKATLVYNNGTNVVDAATYFSSLTLGSALPIASGGTASTSTTYVNLAANVTGVLPIANGGTNSSTSAGAAFALKGANSDITSITGLTTALTVAQGGTGSTTLAAATIATQGYTTTATAAGTTTLTVSSTQLQFFTGVTTQTVTLPVASTLTAGQRFEIHNNSTGSVTVNSSGANLVATVLASTTTVLTCILTSGTTAASWDADIQGFTTTLPTTQGGTGLTAIGTANQVLAVNSGATALEFQTAAGGQSKTQVFTAPGTWTNPGSVTSAKVFLVGGGGGSNSGGAGGGTGGVLIANVSPIPSSPVAITVGAGGAGGNAPGGTGSTGGTSSFGAFVSATGGPGGPGGNGTGSVSTGTAIFNPSLGISGAYSTPTDTGRSSVYMTSGGLVNGNSAQAAVAHSIPGSIMAGGYSITPPGGTGQPGKGGTGGVIVVEFVG